MQPPADDAEIVAAARARLPGEDWDLAMCLTDLPLEADRRPVVAHASPVHGMAVMSQPALGAVGPRRRALQTTLGLVRALLGNGEATDPTRLAQRLRELASDPADSVQGVRFTARVLSGNVRLPVGMVRANRPWGLAARLSRAGLSPRSDARGERQRPGQCRPELRGEHGGLAAALQAELGQQMRDVVLHRLLGQGTAVRRSDDCSAPRRSTPAPPAPAR